MNQYNEYNIIEKHIEFSRELHSLNLIGKSIIKSIELKKHLRIKRSGNYVFGPDVLVIYNNIIDLTNIKRFNKLRLYFCIQYYLDELLFNDIKTLDIFNIEDESYKLTDLYFNQSLWNPLLLDDINIGNFTDDKFLTADEAIILKSYIRQYINFMESLTVYLDTLIDIDYIKRKITNIFNKIRLKIILVDTILIKIIGEDLH
jgi:hypothetical protein